MCLQSPWISTLEHSLPPLLSIFSTPTKFEYFQSYRCPDTLHLVLFFDAHIMACKCYNTFKIVQSYGGFGNFRTSLCMQLIEQPLIFRAHFLESLSQDLNHDLFKSANHYTIQHITEPLLISTDYILPNMKGVISVLLFIFLQRKIHHSNTSANTNV